MKKKGVFFASVLVDIDLLSPFLNQLLVEHSGFAFIANVEYEWLPPFFSHCKLIGMNLLNVVCFMRRFVLLALNISLLILGNRERLWGIQWFLNNIKSIGRKMH